MVITVIKFYCDVSLQCVCVGEAVNPLITSLLHTHISRELISSDKWVTNVFVSHSTPFYDSCGTSIYSFGKYTELVSKFNKLVTSVANINEREVSLREWTRDGTTLGRG